MIFIQQVCYFLVMSKAICTSCQKPKANLQCGVCHCNLCKNCTQFLDDDTFSFLAEIPKELSHSCYCYQCYLEKVAPELTKYNETMEKAKEILVYNKSQSKETRLIKRLEDPITIENYPDQNQLILRLAFFAAKANYNAIIDLQLSSKKIKNGSYQTTVWTGTAIPANVKKEKLIADRSNWQNPN